MKVFEKFKKDVNNLPKKEIKQVMFSQFSNKRAESLKFPVFSGSQKDCALYIRAQSIDAKQKLSDFDGVLKVYRTPEWSRIELLKISDNEDVEYYASTYEMH